ncbi:hypothetical protein BT96DRAFT_913818 [Gymnopus androsaceus JB14]|uniref:Uncharacterized protein n=1 Tax=Gymnopus androsaceus JB14 TaxID=1447944 RepID=A0A6A4IG18_9AGAR|nr:hypothetical protein BT96DRAFT_913818 [Gymnopus androsaceus JB14]
MENDTPPAFVPSPMRRHSTAPGSIRRPLRSSPLAGPAMSSEGLVVLDEGHQQGKPKPSRISSTPDLPSVSSDLTMNSTDPIPPLPSAHYLGTVTRSKFNERKSLPSGFLSSTSFTPFKSPSAPSLPIPVTPPPSPTKASPRPPSRESTKSLPASTHTTVPPNFPRALHRNSSPVVNTGNWLTTNTHGETPRFSRFSMASNVVMPVSAKEHRRKSLASVKSSPNLRDRAYSPSESIMWTRSGSSGRSSEEADAACIFVAERVHLGGKNKSISSALASKVHKRTSALGKFMTMSSDASGIQSTYSDSMHSLHSGSDTSLSSVGDDLDSFPSPPPRAFGSAQSRGSSISDCGIIDEEAEDDAPENTPEVVPVESASDHKRSLSSTSSKSGKFTVKSVGSLKSRAKSTLSGSKPFVDSRVISDADSVLGSTATSPVIAPRKHTKGFSFLSFTSSDDSHTPPIPPLQDGILSSSHNSFESSPDDRQNEVKQLLYDALPHPAPVRNDVTPTIHRSFLSSRRSSNSRSTSEKVLTLLRSPPPALNTRVSYTAPPTSALPSPPSPSSSSSHYSPTTPVSPVALATMLTPPSPTRARSRSDKAERMLALDMDTGIGFCDRPYNSPSENLDLPTSTFRGPLPFSPQPSKKSKAASFLGIDGDTASTRSFSRATGSSKAMSLLGVGEPGLAPLGGPLRRPRPSKSASLLGFGDVDKSLGTSLLSVGEPGVIMRNNSESHLDATLGFRGSTVRGTQKTGGTMRKLWKNLTGVGKNAERNKAWS